ncbi:MULTISPECIES: SDR family NAD(P)-dependent oxidoreductase [unclassified Parafrankia]|uniref:SDR family NAD(P)-dependent oxidoreductase n=1 Tax=unclassified Parafrankia TaxID=2994368 RepID=UPI000DA4670B|nr:MULTISPECIES: SDR family NAD(P)-dependent oxidoreductase [unclassified Parafrankia]TCJ40043.1 SDR family oxidoreductase [Parafrankia sp. BMG5.11]SQD95986.1 putative enzyme [Parafrankia sp. Ea1.12]
MPDEMPVNETPEDETPAKEHAGKVALITGGGRGFGKAFGAALTERGAHVVLADIDGDVASAAAAELTALGGSATGVACDVTDEARVGEVVADIVRAHGGLDILVNNAGLHSAAFNKPTAELGAGRIRRLFEVNVLGVVICTLAAKDAMSGRPGAAVVNISSSAAYANRTAYGVSKLAVRGFTAQFARELASVGVRVNAIAPGLILTDTVRAELPATEVARVLAQQVLAREGAERDVVNALLYLVSDAAAFITGETLRVTGGFALSV